MEWLLSHIRDIDQFFHTMEKFAKGDKILRIPQDDRKTMQLIFIFAYSDL
jgi:hypothetical protein